MAAIESGSSLEIEGKYRVQSFVKIRERLKLAGATGPEIQEQRDIYFTHPNRDFTQTDEALRIRYSGDKCTVTYKGPRKDGFALKAREELNLEVNPAGTIETILRRLGFSPVHEVIKVREVYSLREAVISLDKISGLGTYVEIELAETIGTLDPETMLSHLKEMIGIEGAHIPYSYLELLLAKKS